MASMPFPSSQQLPRIQTGLGQRRLLAICSHTPWLGLRGPEADWWSLPASPHSHSHFSVPCRIPFSSVPWLLESQARPVWKQKDSVKRESQRGNKGSLLRGRGTSSAQGKLQDKSLLGGRSRGSHFPLDQWLSTFLMLHTFNAVCHVVVTPTPTIK